MGEPIIEVTPTGTNPPQFLVRVRDAAGETRHTVSLERSRPELRDGGARGEALIEAAFRFLLDREPKTAILASFDLDAIGRYFPEFERELPRYMSRVRPSPGT